MTDSTGSNCTLMELKEDYAGGGKVYSKVLIVP